VAKVVGWVDFENRDDLKHMQRLRQHPKFSGLRPMIQDIDDVDWMHRPDVQWAFSALIDLDMTFDALGFPLHLDAFQRLFDRYPAMRTVIDHGMKPSICNGAFEPWAAKMHDIAKNTTAYCKLSGLATEAQPGWTVETLKPYAQHILSCFGPSRVMWGSDWPVLELNGSYDAWFTAAQTIVGPDPQARAQIFGQSAREFYGIDDR
jgi:L-fuconolactonase